MFSEQDRTAMKIYRFWVPDLDPELYFGFGVLEQDALRIAVLERDAFRSVPIRILGGWTLDFPLRYPVSADAETRHTAVDAEMYDRHNRFLGEHGQRVLGDTHVAVVGWGDRIVPD